MSDGAALSTLPNGTSFEVEDVSGLLPIAARLSVLGLSRGSRGEKLYSGFGGSPIAVRISGAVICIRKSDAAHIICRLPEKGDNYE